MVKKNKRFIKNIILFGIISYVLFILVSQQKDLYTYKKQQVYYSQQIQEQEEEKAELLSEKENAESDEFVEKIAREKLNMYYPNERVYISINN